MSAFTNTGADVLERQVGEGECGAACVTLEEMYEIPRCVAWVRHGHYHKVCLQFPDELLRDAAGVAETLTHHLSQPVYILGDTTYGSCCVDEVAAEHVGADAVIHFGNTCLSPSQRLPVLYIHTRLHVDVPWVVEQLKDIVEDKEGNHTHPLVLLFDTRCQYIAGEVFSELCVCLPHLVCSSLEDVRWKEHTPPHTPVHTRHTQQDHSEQQSTGCCGESDSCISDSKCNDSEKCHKPVDASVHDHRPNECNTSGCSSVVGNTSNTHHQVTFSGRCVVLPNKTDIKDCSFIYLGPQGPSLDSLLLRFAASTFYHVPPTGGRAQKVSGMQSLFRRNIKLEMIRDATIIGILVGTLGVARYRESIARLKTIIKSAGKRSYTFVVGKPNEPKLANISEVDVFVYVACPETTLVDRAADPVLYRKVVAPWEVEVALLAGREWSMNFESDFSALLPGGCEYMEVCEATRHHQASVSLITNKTQTLGLRDTVEESSGGPVMVQEGKAVAALHVGGGGQVLGGRTWAGLDPSHPPPSTGTVVVEGRKGIAAEYQDEQL